MSEEDALNVINDVATLITHSKVILLDYITAHESIFFSFSSSLISSLSAFQQPVNQLADSLIARVPVCLAFPSSPSAFKPLTFTT